MKNTVTPSHTHAALSFSVALNTPGMHIYKMKSIRRKRCSLRNTYIRLRFHNINETYATQLDGCPTINLQNTPASTNPPAALYKRTVQACLVQFEVAVLIGSGPKPRRLCDLRRC